MFYLSIILGKITILLLRFSGKGGSALPGLITEKINQTFLDQFGRRFKGKTIIITGTNRSGSNIKRAIISSIIEEASWFGGFKQNYAVFEVDEAYAPIVAKAINPPNILVALNIFRDQLDRFAELDKTYNYIEDAARYSAHVIVNIDDPLLRKITKLHESVTSFGAATDIRKQLPSDEDLHGNEAYREITTIKNRLKFDQMIEILNSVHA